MQMDFFQNYIGLTIPIVRLHVNASYKSVFPKKYLNLASALQIKQQIFT